MTDDFDSYVVTEPTRTRKGALKYQPPDADWSLERLGELQDYYQTTYKRKLPVTVAGQGSIHRKWGLDHRASADISLNPTTSEGQAFITELQRRKIPFLAFDRAIPGAATGPHIHVGRPSHRTATAANYSVGSQVKRQKQQKAAPADDFDSYVTADNDFDSYTVADTPSKPAAPAARPPVEEALGRIQRSATTITGEVQRRAAARAKLGFGTQLPTDAVAAGVRDDDLRQRNQLARAVDEYERQRTGSSNIGELRRADERELDQQRRVTAEVRRERAVKRGLGMPVSYNPITAVQEYLAGEERVVQQETDRRLQAGYAETGRLREIASQFTDTDREQLASVYHTLSGGSPVERGIGTGTWRVGSGLLYKLAALADIATKPPNKPGVLGDYLRRKAAIGEIAVSELEADLPPPVRQQLADFVAHSVLALPEMAGAVAAGGPVGGFAALGGLEAAGRKQPFSEVARETAKGAVIGGVFAGAGAVESGVANRTFAQRAADTARSSVAIGLGTAATEKVFGATDEEALRAAATNVVFHVGMRVPGEVGRLAQAAEKAYTTPPTEGGTPTVGPELQERLSRTEAPAQTSTPLATESVAPRRVSELNRVEKISLAEAIERSQVPFEGPPAYGEGIAPRRAAVTPSGDKALDAAREAGLDYGIEIVEVPGGYTIQRHSGSHIADVVTSAQAEAVVRNAILAEPLPSVPPAKPDTRPPSTASPAAEPPVALQAAVPSLPEPTITRAGKRKFIVEQETSSGRVTHTVKSRGEAEALVTQLTQQPATERRAIPRPEGYEVFSPERRAEFLSQLEALPTPELVELGQQLRPAERAADVQAATRRPLSDLMAERAEAGPTEAPKPFRLSEADRKILRDAGHTEWEIDSANQAMVDRAKSGRAFYRGEIQPVTQEIADQVKAEYGRDIAEARAELAKLEKAKREGKTTFSAAEIDRLTGRSDHRGGPTDKFISETKRHIEDLEEGIKRFQRQADRTAEIGPIEEGDAVNLLANKPTKRPPSSEGGFIDIAEVIDAVKELRAKFPDRTERELRAMLPVTHRELLDREQPLPAAATQPRTPTGQFSPGAPGGVEAERSLLRTEARRYGQRYKSLDLHQARRNGLDIVNDDVARNYFAQLHRMASEFLPEQAKAVDRAETLYNQGKYGQATMLAESVFRSLPDKVNEYAGADAAMQLVERGITPRANWSKILQEVKQRTQRGLAEARERAGRTGPLSGGGSTFYDVNKYPEGGRPDHAKIAYILEPVIAALKDDARLLMEQGKLSATDYVAHVRKAVNDMLQREEFTDWHPLNKSAALGVLVDRLRKDGPPPIGKPPTTEAQPPQQRQRSLPKTLEASGRDPGTNTAFDRLPNRQVNERVEARLTSEGAASLETWYRNAPESADRTAAHRVLVDHYTAEAVKLADTAPQRAEALYQRGRDLSNLEAERATTLGQAVQLYSNLLKYTPAGVTAELARMERAGVKVPAEATTRLAKTAQEHQRLDSEVRRLERQVVEAEAAESGGPAPEGAAKPRQYRPRGDTVIDSRAERVRRQLDEAAKRRRAAKAAIAAQLRALESQRTVPGYLKRISNITRGLMVSAFSTAMRNLQTQVLRFDVERLTDTVEHTLRRTVGLDSDLSYRNIWRNAVRQFRPGQTTEARELLAGHPGEFQRLFNTYAGGVEVPIRGNARNAVEKVFQTVERGVEIANIFNRIQEHHVRSAEFLAELDLHLRKDHNQTLEQFVSRNGIDAIPLDTLRKGVDKALEVTFSDMPLRDGAGGRFLTSMIEVGNYIPPTLSPVAFPRFMFNNLKFLYQYSPVGMLDLARKNQNKPRVIARSLVGTSMLLLAYQFRNSDHAGEKWYELKVGGHTLDARPFGPFSTYLFFAEGIRRQLAGEKAFTVEEIAGAIGASTGPSGTAIAVAQKLYDYAANGKWDKWQRVLKTEAGEWGRALLTPVRQVKDIIAAFDASQAVTRDTSAEPFLGEIKESIPYADTNLPPAHRPTTATPIHQERPATKALSGWRVITPKSFLERQLDELNFKGSEILSSTGDREADAVLRRVMGPLADELSRELENDAAFKAMSKAARANYLREELSRIRREARSLAEEENPELFDKLREDRKPERQRKYEEELNSPGLSKAIDLGVPMPIPPRQPNEDDIAYRARLLQVGRQRRTRLDNAINPALSMGQQRATLHSALYS